MKLAFAISIGVNIVVWYLVAHLHLCPQ